MAERCFRLLPRGPRSLLSNLAQQRIPVTCSGPNSTRVTRTVRHGSSYFNSVYPVDDQTIIKEGTERVRVTRRNEGQYLPTQQYSDVNTIYEGFYRGKKCSNDGPLLGSRTGPDNCYEWMSFSQLEEKARLFGAGLMSLGMLPNGESFVGIFATNRAEWTIADFACVCHSIVTVPLYTSLGKDAIKYIVNQTNMSLLICDTMQKAETVLGESAALPSLKTVVVCDLPADGTDDTQRRFEAAGLKLLSFNDVLSAGTANPCELVIPTPSSLNTVVYTSGTTGVPKGVPLTHRHYIVNHANIHSTFDVGIYATPKDVHLSYLPLAHVFERATQYHCLIHGVPMGYSRGDPLLLLDDIQTLKPTFLFGVPRVYNKIYHEVMLSVSNASPVKRALFNFAYQQKLKELKRGVQRRDTIWDKLVFKKIQDIFGGRIRLLFSGAAPISAEVSTFYRATMGCVFFEGYGQTETTSCITHTIDTDMTAGHVGIPGADMQIKLVDVPELNYFSTEDVGEVCVKGSNVFDGYFKEPEKTKEAFDEDGWLHTGDIGRWNKNGTLSIIDRKKQIFKLSQGVYVTPEKVENVYIRLPLVMQIFIYGDSLQPHVVGIVVPDPTALKKIGEGKRVTGSYEDLCKSEVVTNAVLKVLQKHGKDDGLQGFEQVQAIALHPEQFSEQNGLLTPTLKSRRTELKKYFQNELDRLNQNLERS
ncbi:long-chain-fatty-acid--CoA ligase 5-like [Diadema antillarum]|uniref:long-chain-fatty-acid--CoA ligase 5-like n=1 Tax=Diadema antillarum TaxID=105358 RepID=UPI003A83AF18